MKRRGETWKLPRHTALKGESGMGMRGNFFFFFQKSIVFLPLLLGVLFLFLLCRERHAPALTSGWSLSVFLARDSVWDASAPHFPPVAFGNALLLFLPSQAPPFFLESQDLFCQRRATALTSVLLLFPCRSKDLSELMKEATKEVHEQAENTPFMRNFQKGQVSLHEFKVFHSSVARGWDFLNGKYTIRSDRLHRD